MKAIRSFIDSKGRVFIDCAECDRGGNGTHRIACFHGKKIKRAGLGGCYRDGLIIPKLNQYLKRRGA
jgi:hypothetical protein